MLNFKLLMGGALFCAIALSACSSSGNTPVSPGGGINGTGGAPGTINSNITGTAGAAQTVSKGQIVIPGLKSGGPFTYDLITIDPPTGIGLLADRASNAVDVFNARTNAFIGFINKGGFAGQKASNDQSGPDGIVNIPGTTLAYIGDVNKTWLIDFSAMSVVKTFATGSAGLRTDEGCYDAADDIVELHNTADSPPYITWITNASKPALAAIGPVLQLPGSAGLEDCKYDPGTKAFYANNDGTPANPTGELDQITAASVKAGAPVIANTFGLSQCQPTGLALGPSGNMIIGCDPPAGLPEETLIFNMAKFAVVATIPQVGGEDMVAYNPVTNRYYTASRRMTTTGFSTGGGGGLTPVVGVIDATSNTWVENVKEGSGIHAVVADPVTGRVFVPSLAPPSPLTNAPSIDIYGAAGLP